MDLIPALSEWVKAALQHPPVAPKKACVMVAFGEVVILRKDLLWRKGLVAAGCELLNVELNLEIECPRGLLHDGGLRFNALLEVDLKLLYRFTALPECGLDAGTSVMKLSHDLERSQSSLFG